jgi:hypothetical protein
MFLIGATRLASHDLQMHLLFSRENTQPQEDKEGSASIMWQENSFCPEGAKPLWLGRAPKESDEEVSVVENRPGA